MAKIIAQIVYAWFYKIYFIAYTLVVETTVRRDLNVVFNNKSRITTLKNAAGYAKTFTSCIPLLIIYG